MAGSRAPMPIVDELATTAGAGGRHTCSSPETPTAKGVDARDHIGNGPWQNAKGIIAQNVDDLHNADEQAQP